MKFVNIATEDGPKQVKANVFQLDFDGGKLAVFKEQGSAYLSHYASGQILCKLSVFQLGKYRAKDVAQESLDRAVRLVGAEKFRQTLSEAPTINP